eukprot:463695-Pelagomonas_calceolata.AAC.3
MLTPPWRGDNSRIGRQAGYLLITFCSLYLPPQHTCRKLRAINKRGHAHTWADSPATAALREP